MNFKALIKQKLDEQAALVKNAMAESRPLTIDEQKKFDDLEIEIKNLEKTAEAAEKVAKIEETQNKIVTDPIFATPKNPDEKKWKNMGEFLNAVRLADSGMGYDNRLGHKFVNAASGANEGVGSEGGFLVEETYVSGLIADTYNTATLASKAKKIPLGANSNRMVIPGIDETSRADGSRWGGIQAYWAAEAGTVTASKTAIKKIELELNKLLAFFYVTDELLADSTALEAYIKMAFPDEMAFKVDDAILRGSGAGVPLGILNSGALVTVAKEAGQAAATVVHANIQKMWLRLLAKNRLNAEWFINQDTEQQLCDMTFGTGVEMSPLAKEYNEKGTLKGRPVNVIEQCSTLGTVGDIVLADMTDYFMIEKAAQTDVSMHVRFLYDEQVFRFSYRCDGKPKRYVPLTPKNGSTTYSTFVTLATR